METNMRKKNNFVEVLGCKVNCSCCITLYRMNGKMVADNYNSNVT